MKNFIVFLLVLISVKNKSFAQFENRYWFMGYSNFTDSDHGGFNLDFYNNQPDTIRIDRELNVAQGTSNISSKDGRFLFATNGAKIGDASNHIMLNGDSLLCLGFCNPSDDGSNMFQPNIIIPDPGDTNLYYIFYSTGEYYLNTPIGTERYPLHMYYATIDMRLNGGSGAVTSKNVIMHTDTLQLGQISACKHANGRDWWLVFKGISNNKFITYLITPYGIQFINNQPFGNPRYQPSYVCFSPDGSKYASYDHGIGLQIFDFDRCTGIFSNPVYIPYTDTVPIGAGVAFSPSSRFLYTSTTNTIFQYDLQAANIGNSKTLVGIWDGFYDGTYGTYFLTMALARDGKIYCITGNSTHYIHRINLPDQQGASCNFQQRYVTTPVFYWRAIPNHPNYQLGSESFSSCDTLTGIIEMKKKYSFTTYPNPVLKGEKIYVEFNHVGNEEGHFEISDINGKKIYYQKISAFTSILEVQIPVLSPGFYIIKLKFKDWEESDKLVIE